MNVQKNFKSVEEFRKLEVNLTNVRTLHNIKHTYNRFLETLAGLYDIALRKRKLRIKKKILKSLWMIKALQKLSKRKKGMRHISERI